MLTHLTMKTFLLWALTMKTYKFLLEDPPEQELLLSFLKIPAGHYLLLMRMTAMWIWAASLALRTSSKPQTRKQKGTVINSYVRPASLGQTGEASPARYRRHILHVAWLIPPLRKCLQERLEEYKISLYQWKKKRHQINSLPCKSILASPVDLDPMVYR